MKLKLLVINKRYRIFTDCSTLVANTGLYLDYISRANYLSLSLTHTSKGAVFDHLLSDSVSDNYVTLRAECSIILSTL